METSKVFVPLIEPDNYPSQSVFNAMANGNALIVSDTGASKEKFIQNNGYAVKLTTDDVVTHIQKIIEENKFEDFSNASKKLFNDKYKPELYFEECKKLYIN